MVKSENAAIQFTLVCRERTYQMQAQKDQYDSLMCLISDHFPIRGFGICYGGGCCGTCGVEVREEVSGERKFILSCEIEIDEELTNKKISVLR